MVLIYSELWLTGALTDKCLESVIKAQVETFSFPVNAQWTSFVPQFGLYGLLLLFIKLTSCCHLAPEHNSEHKLLELIFNEGNNSPEQIIIFGLTYWLYVEFLIL